MKKEDFTGTIEVNGRNYRYFDILKLAADGIADVQRLPFSIRILTENLLRKMDGRVVREEDLRQIAGWRKQYDAPVEIPYHPARVLMQDFTGVPAVVDLAAMRDAFKKLGGDPAKVSPLVPVDLVVDHSVQVDAYGNVLDVLGEDFPGSGNQLVTELDIEPPQVFIDVKFVQTSNVDTLDLGVDETIGSLAGGGTVNLNPGTLATGRPPSIRRRTKARARMSLGKARKMSVIRISTTSSHPPM